MKFSFHTPRMATAILVSGLLLMTAGCATPVGVRRLDPEAGNRTLTTSVLSGGALSASTTQILNRSGLAQQFQKNPAAVIAALHRGLPTAPPADQRFALAELSFLHGTRSGDSTYFRAAAIYAYAFLYPGDGDVFPHTLDPRLRLAVDLYNLGIARGLVVPESDRVTLKSGWRKLPFGDLTLRTEEDEFRWGPYRLTNFRDATRIGVRGLRNRYRWPGIGAPLVATLKPMPGERTPADARIPPSLRVAVTAFIEFDDLEGGFESGHFTGTLRLFTPGEVTDLEFAGRRVPIEYSQTVALAASLDGSQAYRFEIRGLLSGEFDLFSESSWKTDNVILLEPYRPGRIPVVFIHGTASSPARWAEMLNELQNDRALWDRCQFWLFTYNTGNPILYSGGILTSSLRQVVSELDPDGRDDALSQMVVIGHSQGGMLARMTAIDSGSRFWDDAFAVPIDRMDISPDTESLLRRSMFYKPLPFVKRVIFIATPHRGSFVAGGRIGQLASRLIDLPFRLISPITEVFEKSPEAVAKRSIEDIPRSTDNMTPSDPFVQTFSSIPVSPGIAAHSIIAVKNPEDPKEKWNDGVVTYRSAHLDGTASEIVIKAGHSVQSDPGAIEEVRRILMEHLEQVTRASLPTSR